jgi:hypothetical protein
MLIGERRGSRRRRDCNQASSFHLNRGVFRRDLEEKPAGVGFQGNVPMSVAHLEFVVRAHAQAGKENFPDPRRAEQPQGMKPPVPMVEIADDADALRVRRPNGEAGAGQAVNHAPLRAEFFIKAAFVALAEQEQVRLTERRQK